MAFPTARVQAGRKWKKKKVLRGDREQVSAGWTAPIEAIQPPPEAMKPRISTAECDHPSSRFVTRMLRVRGCDQHRGKQRTFCGHCECKAVQLGSLERRTRTGSGLHGASQRGISTTWGRGWSEQKPAPGLADPQFDRRPWMRVSVVCALKLTPLEKVNLRPEIVHRLPGPGWLYVCVLFWREYVLHSKSLSSPPWRRLTRPENVHKLLCT